MSTEDQDTSNIRPSDHDEFIVLLHALHKPAVAYYATLVPPVDYAQLAQLREKIRQILDDFYQGG